MADFSSESFQRSLAETIAWCDMQSLGTDQVDLDAIRKRHSLYVQSEQQLQEARLSASQGWFRRKISDTKQWQQAMALLKQIRDSLGPMEHRLRSAELKPTFSLDDFGARAPWEGAVAEVVAKRSQLTNKIPPKKEGGTAVVGRLLFYNPSENLACGAAQVSSNGFFDVNNVPPWDIWVDFSEGILVSWVPLMLVQVAQMGIDVNPEECIRWGD
jgi:hypothetical protein